MAWRKEPSARRRRRANRSVPPHNAMVASARILGSDKKTLIDKKRWQDEAWAFYETQGELWYATTWLSNATSRIRLRAARITPDSDEPEIVTDGPAAELVEQLAGGIGGQAAMLASFATKLTIVGDSYLVGMETEDGSGQKWMVLSADVLRKENTGGFSIQVGEGDWQPLPNESLVVRVWQSDERYPWLAFSPTKPALSVLREIDLYNRRIVADLTSRLASNGLFFIPEEVTFPIREEYSDANDPFVAEWVDISSKTINNPGSASAAIPIPLRVPSAMIDKFRHMSFSTEVTQETLDARDRAIKRFATMINIPAEVLTGLGNVNHWGAWQIEEQAIKIHVAPLMEIICAGLTTGYLLPGLSSQSLDVYADELHETDQADLADGERWVVWYDVSELKEKPDQGERATQGRQMNVLTDAAWRSANGFDESDAPNEDELRTQILTDLATKGMPVADSFGMLTGEEVPSGQAPVPGASSGGVATTSSDDEEADLPADSPPGIGPPPTSSERPSTPNPTPPSNRTRKNAAIALERVQTFNSGSVGRRT